MPKYQCPDCGAQGFDSLYDIQRHALNEHGHNVTAIIYNQTNQEAVARRMKTMKNKFFQCRNGG